MDTKDGVEGVWDGSKVGAEEVRGLEALVGSMSRGRGEEKERRAEEVMDTGAGAEGEGEGNDGGEAMDTS